jgi:hypothetical protein
MDTERMDQTLQLLNARILQTIEALNQIRLSANNVSPVGVTPIGVGGLVHAAPNFFVNPYAVHPYFAQSQVLGAMNAPVSPVLARLGHSSPNVFDRMYTRLATVFPVAPWGYSPFVQSYVPVTPRLY